MSLDYRAEREQKSRQRSNILLFFRFEISMEHECRSACAVDPGPGRENNERKFIEIKKYVENVIEFVVCRPLDMAISVSDGPLGDGGDKRGGSAGFSMN